MLSYNVPLILYGYVLVNMAQHTKNENYVSSSMHVRNVYTVWLPQIMYVLFVCCCMVYNKSTYIQERYNHMYITVHAQRSTVNIVFNRSNFLVIYLST